MTDKNASDVKQSKLSSGVGFKPQSFDVKKIFAPAIPEMEKQSSTISRMSTKVQKEYGYNIS